MDMQINFHFLISERRPDQELNLDILSETTFPGLRLTIGPSGLVYITTSLFLKAFESLILNL